MILRVERRGDELVIPIPPDVVRAMGLKEGDEVIVRRVDASYERQMDAFVKTEPSHRRT